MAPKSEATPTPFLARRLADAIGLEAIPIHWAKQVHGTESATVTAPAPGGHAENVGECDAIVTALPGTAVVVQSADCVPILLAAPAAVAAAHAGWRGSAKNVAASPSRALGRLGAKPASLRSGSAPDRVLLLEVGGDVAAQFAGDFVRRLRRRIPARFTRRQRHPARQAGVPREDDRPPPRMHPLRREAYASYRRDSANAGRMIASSRVRPDSRRRQIRVPRDQLLFAGAVE
jgi:copper oxidase (laccase) domain-containing protein